MDTGLHPRRPQVDHVFLADDEVTGVIDWSEAAQGDALFDLIRAWWSWRCLTNVRWLAEHGYGPPEEYPEVAVLRSWL